MKNMLVGLALVGLLCGMSRALTMNPASHATADSDNTAQTIVLRDASGNFSAGTISAAITGNVTGNVTGNSTGNLDGQFGGNLAYAAVGSGEGNKGIYISTTIPVVSGSSHISFESLISSGGIVTLTSVPSISTTTVLHGATAIATGSYLILTSTAAAPNAVVLTDDGTLTGSCLQLGATTRTISLYKTLTLVFGADGYWREVSYSNN